MARQRRRRAVPISAGRCSLPPPPPPPRSILPARAAERAASAARSGPEQHLSVLWAVCRCPYRCTFYSSPESVAGLMRPTSAMTLRPTLTLNNGLPEHVTAAIVGLPYISKTTPPACASSIWKTNGIQIGHLRSRRAAGTWSAKLWLVDGPELCVFYGATFFFPFQLS